MIEEYIPGETYEDIFREQGPLSEEETVELGIELCRALSTIHALNPPVIHRDVKPSNVIRQRGQDLLSHIIEKATAFEPSGRYQNVQEMMEDLKKCLVSAKSFSAKSSLLKSVFVKTAPEYPRPWQKYLPPGFRSLSFTHMIPAIFGYLLIFAIGSGTVVTDANGAAVTGIQLWLNRACVTALEYVEDSLWGQGIKVKVENNSKENIAVTLDSMSAAVTATTRFLL